NAETLKIGVIAALTGGGAPWGIAAQEGIGAVAEEINAAGGLDVGGTNYTLEVIAYDDQYRAPDAIAAYTRLINQDGARYVFIMTSAPAMALKQSVEDDHVVALTTSFSPNVIDENTKY